VERNGEDKVIAQELHDKYGANFTVRDCDMIYSTPPKELEDFTILAYPTNDNQLVFGVKKQQARDGKITYSDTYLQAHWSKEARPEVTNFLAQYYIVVPNFDLIITPTTSQSDAQYNTTPSFGQFRSKVHNDINYDLTIHNYPDASLPMTHSDHERIIVALAQFLSKNYPKSTLKYYTSSEQCVLQTAQIRAINFPADTLNCLQKY
jgi:hypothetical protein